MTGSKKSLINILIVSFALRIIPIVLLGLFEDIQSGSFKLTDIDYKVYSDSTQYPTPYGRHTYRYTPLLSYLMTFNYSIYQGIGKIIFSCFDLIAIYFLWNIIAKNQKNQQSSNASNKQQLLKRKIKHADFIAKLYGFNPLFIYLTVRGSCESIALALMYSFWYFFFGKNSSGSLVPQQIKENKIEQFQTNSMHKIYAYAIYGLWVHFRIYPIIFLPLIIIYEYRNCVNQSFSKFISRLVSLGICAGGVFIFLLIAFYSLYGDQFIQETYLFHAIRKDNRHSFSPFFYDIYLHYFQSKPHRMLPSACLLFLLVSKYSKNYSMFYLQFLMTFAFVQFNTVITLQYYHWVWGALFLVLPESRIITFNNHSKGFNLAIQWALMVGVWVWMSLQLQNQGDNILFGMWVICIVKILMDLWVLIGFMKTVKVQNREQTKKINLEEAKQLLMGKHKNS